MGVGEMFFDSQIAFIVKKAIQNISSITVCTLDRDAVKGCIIVGHKRVKFERLVLEPGTPGLLQHFLFVAESLAITAGGFTFSPMASDI